MTFKLLYDIYDTGVYNKLECNSIDEVVLALQEVEGLSNKQALDEYKRYNSYSEEVVQPAQ